METKKVSSGFKNWLKVLCVALAAIPCMFLLTACGGETIEQDEALLALAAAQTTMDADETNTFTITMEQRLNGGASGVNADMNVKNTIAVYTDASGNVTARVQANGTVRGELSSYIDIDANLNADYKVATIDGVNYFINENEKTYEVAGVSDYSDMISFGSYASAVDFINASMLVDAEGVDIATDLKKMGENDYNLRFTITTTTSLADVDTTTTTVYYYEIRDSKITKFQNTATMSSDEGNATQEMILTFDYTNRSVSAPTSIEGYEVGSVYFDMSDLGNIMP